MQAAPSLSSWKKSREKLYTLHVIPSLMGALSSFPRALKLALTQPALLIPALIYALLALPQMLMQFFKSGTSFTAVAADVAYVLLLWLISPFFTGGLLSTAAQALEGGVDLTTFFQNAKRVYLYLLLAVVIYGLAMFIGLFLLVVVGFLLAAAAKLVFSSGFAIAFALVFVVLGGVVLLVVMLMLSFYDVGVAIEGLDPVQTFKNSFRFVKSHFASVIGFLLLTTFAALIIYLPMALVLLYHFLTVMPSISIAELEAGTLPAPSFGTAVLLILSTLISNTIATSFLHTYRAVFYVSLTREGMP